MDGRSFQATTLPPLFPVGMRRLEPLFLVGMRRLERRPKGQPFPFRFLPMDVGSPAHQQTTKSESMTYDTEVP
jgi:hypothetical protein